MRSIVLGVFLGTIMSVSTFAQFSQGFNNREALDMIAICNSFTFQDVYGDDNAIIPKSYTKVYQSESIGLDNKWQLLKNDKFAVINVRGSTGDPLSWMANIYSAMIPANGTITLPGGKVIPYYLSDNPLANVHAGWTLAMVFLSQEVVLKIRKLNAEGIFHFIITGHSQGAAIAQLLRAYLEHAPDNIVDKRNEFKTYVFASPKPGNKFFARNYSNYFSNSSFVVNNPKDPVITMPLSKSHDPFFDVEEAYEHLSDTNRSYLTALAFKAVGRILGGTEDSMFIKKSGAGVYRQISKETGEIEMPDYVADMSYCLPVDERFIEPFNEKYFIGKKFYSDFKMDASNIFYQHKPYLYFLEFQREFFNAEFKNW